MLDNLLNKVALVAKSFSDSSVNDFRVRVNKPNVIGFYTPHSNAGCSALLASVANELHTPSDPVVIVDLDYIARTQAYYFLDEGEIPYSKSIKTRLSNPAVGVQEIVNYAGDKSANIGVIGSSAQEHPMDWALPSEGFYKNLLEALSSQFGYVLVDIPSCINTVECIESIMSCDTVYSVIRPITSQISELLYVKQIVASTTPYRGIRDKIKTVIQTQVNGNHFSVNDFKDAGLELKGNTFQDLDLMSSMDNCKLPKSITNKNVKTYIEFSKALAEEIKASVNRNVVDTNKN
jgi:cellulose biosynthesis protein BcsQ